MRTAFDLGPSSIPTCSGIALHCLIVEKMLGMSGGVCEPRHENGTTVHRAAVCHLFLCAKLGDSATTTHGKLQQALGDDAMSREQDFLWQNPC